jgi:SPP1 family predicted phage head-tail adaptor
MINPGRLDTRCTFWDEVAETDGMGSTTYTWAPIAASPAWCKFEPLRGMEQIEAGKVSSGHHGKITIRRCEDITTSAKVDVLSERWNVNSIEDMNREGWMLLWIHRTD